MSSPTQIALWAASALLSALLAPRRSDKARADVGDVQVHGPTMGTPVPLLWGEDKIMGKCTWHGPFTAVEEGGKKGGKGGGGKKGQQGQTTYRVSWMDTVGFTGGRPWTLRRIWRNDDLLWEGEANEVGITTIQNPGNLDFTWHAGTLDQEPDARMATRQGGLLGQPPGTGSSVAPTTHTEQHVLNGAAPSITLAHTPIVEGSDTIFVGSSLVFTRVTSSPGQNQYTINYATGAVVFGGTYSAVLVTVRYQTPSVWDQQEALGYPGVAYIYHHERNVGPTQSIEPLSYEVCAVERALVPSSNAARVVFQAPNTLFAYTTDRGETWASGSPGTNPFTSIWPDQIGHIWTINPATNRLRRSTDGGSTWADVGNAAPVNIAYSTGTAGVYYALMRTSTGRIICAAATASGVRRICTTDNEGQTWTIRTVFSGSGTAGIDKHSMWVVPSLIGPETLYLWMRDDGLFRSEDDGVTWTRVYNLADFADAPPFFFNPGFITSFMVTRAGTLLLLHSFPRDINNSAFRVRRSTDRGDTWTTVHTATFFPTHFDANSFRYRQRMAQAPTGLISIMAQFHSTNDGVSFSPTPSPPASPNRTGNGMGATSRYIWWGSADNETLYRSEDGLTWVPDPSVPNGSIEAIWPVVPVPTECGDVNPIDVARDIISDPHIGVGSSLAIHAGITNATHQHLQDNDLLVSVLVEQPTSALQLLHDLMSHYSGWAGMVGAQLALGMHRPETVTREIVVADAVERQEPVMALPGERDTKNRLIVTYRSRARRYNDEPYMVPLGRDALRHGVRFEHVRLPYYKRLAPVQKVALMQLALRGTPRPTWEITLGPKDLAVTGGDLVALTAPRNGIVQQPARVMAVGANEAGTQFRLTLQYEPAAALALHRHPLQPPLQPEAPTEPTTDPGPTLATVVELPAEIAGEDIVRHLVAVAGVGHPDWVGAAVYLSLDGGTSYQRVDTYIGPSGTLGSLRRAFTPRAPFWPEGHMEIDVRPSLGQLLSATSRNAALARITLSVVGGELVAYHHADLLEAGVYKLTPVLRDSFDLGQAVLVAGATFAFLGPLTAFPTVDHPHDRVGQTVHYKVVSINRFGVEQSLAAVPAIAVPVVGVARRPSPVHGLQVAGMGSKTVIGSGEIDVTATWRYARRDNPGSAFWDRGDEIPTKHPEFADYRVEVWTKATAGGTYGLRRLAFVTAETYTYAAAANIADNGTYHRFVRVVVFVRRTNGVLSRPQVLDIEVVP